MASSEIQGFVLKGITSLNRKELGRGASILIEDVGETERRLTIESFLRECKQCSMLRHPNIIQFLGVYHRYYRLRIQDWKLMTSCV